MNAIAIGQAPLPPVWVEWFNKKTVPKCGELLNAGELGFAAVVETRMENQIVHSWVDYNGEIQRVTKPRMFLRVDFFTRKPIPKS